MENWIGIAVWIALGMLVALVMKVMIKRPEETGGHGVVLATLGAFAAVIGGMLGVGLFHFEDPAALSLGGTLSAVAMAALMTWIYRWGVRGLV